LATIAFFSCLSLNVLGCRREPGPGSRPDRKQKVGQNVPTRIAKPVKNWAGPPGGVGKPSGPYRGISQMAGDSGGQSVKIGATIYDTGLSRQHNETRALTFRAAIRFDSEGHSHRTMFGEMGAFEFKDKMRGIGQGLDASGNPIPAVPAPTEVQNWAAIAGNDSLIQEALTYFRKSPTWFNIYKALECLTLRFGGDEARFLKLEWEPQAQIKLLKRSANILRHAKKRFKPPEQAITLRDANTKSQQL
jgi:hypothetical protein